MLRRAFLRGLGLAPIAAKKLAEKIPANVPTWETTLPIGADAPLMDDSGLYNNPLKKLPIYKLLAARKRREGEKIDRLSRLEAGNGGLSPNISCLRSISMGTKFKMQLALSERRHAAYLDIYAQVERLLNPLWEPDD